MKTKLLLLFALCSFLYAGCFAQEKQPKLNISFGVSPPIKVEGMGKFFNDDWILGNDLIETPYNRKYFKINNTFTLDYFFKENYFLRATGGLSYRKITENIDYDITGLSPNTGGLERSVWKENLHYIQKNWNGSLGMGYKIKQNKFSQYFGSEFMFIKFGKGTQTGDSYSYNKDYVYDSEYLSTNNYTIIIADGYGCGIGVFAGIDYVISKKIQVSFEISGYYLFIYFNGITTTHLNSYTNINPFFPGQDIYTESWSYQKDKYQQYSFSSIIPKLSIKYSLNY